MRKEWILFPFSFLFDQNFLVITFFSSYYLKLNMSVFLKYLLIFDRFLPHFASNFFLMFLLMILIKMCAYLQVFPCIFDDF